MATPEGKDHSPSPLNLPDFPKLHKEWNERLEKAKALCQKHNTSIHEFHFYTENRVKNRCTICLEPTEEEIDEDDYGNENIQNGACIAAAGGNRGSREFKTPIGINVPSARRSSKNSGSGQSRAVAPSSSGNLRLLRKNTPIVPRSASRINRNDAVVTPISYGGCGQKERVYVGGSGTVEPEQQVGSSMDDTTIVELSVLEEIQNIADPNDTLALQEGLQVFKKASEKVQERIEKVKSELNTGNECMDTGDGAHSEEANSLRQNIKETENAIRKHKRDIARSEEVIESERQKIFDSQNAIEELQLQVTIWKHELENIHN